ncbi:hypothetical protein A3A93_05050 [Candidatus Roizmanbacteria bacterium RIFCSPLOWO2_01_FULL_38_12]|uniref:Glycosyltransferase 2-like domain-containing protein n=1 Tax=Candidatus Roizmanbacteria bacterium RIFCSPLOWO2_01_FULL_38_12 TaxID=1802061 RepID=A0A1F7IX43_9BACT|nr:MAG: hypothetical protein A3A93_05050 [Candidatus Roizmanbacteria bacterium RIFCSPLOWO2_01_FULL_38_12]
MSPFLSVIIPTLNEEKYLPRLLKDLSSQTNKDFEVVVVDGNSEDKTAEIALKFRNKCNERLITSDKRNLAYQRNLGVKQAKGSYVLFLDADMRIKRDFISKLIKNAKDHKYLAFIPLHIPENAEYQDELLYKVMSFFVEMSHLTEKPFSYGPVAMFQRDYFNTLGGYDENVFVYEDHEIIQRGRKRGVHAKLLTKVPVYFSMRRFKKEGRVQVLSKYLIAAMQLLANGKVDKKVFTYEMGGSAKYLLAKKKRMGLADHVSKYFDKLKNILEEEEKSS